MNWDVLLSYSLKAVLLPPGVNILLLVAGLLLLKNYFRTGISAIVVSIVSLILMSLPSVSDSLMRQVEETQAISTLQLKRLSAETNTKRAIVVLSGGRLQSAPEYEGIDTVNAATLTRIRYASWLQKRTGLPVLVSGGSVFNEATPEAVLMNQVMTSSFTIAPRWIESNSKNTAENALFSAQILKADDIQQILLVTHAWHMPRARQAFVEQDIAVIEAPTAFQASRRKQHSWTRYLPNARALAQSNTALHELLGQLWYQLRY